MAQQQIQKISKDTIIAEILQRYPEKAQTLSQQLMSFGIHCVGCGSSTMETLEEGVLGHGYSEKELDVLIATLNKTIREKSARNTMKAKEFNLQLTPKALVKVKSIMQQEKKKNAVLRVSVLAGGCSGNTYDMEIIEQAVKSDLHFKQDGVSISIDKSSMDYLNGTTIDFVDTLNESGFKFQNPNAHKSCGCGKSFR
ncbi:MAG: iron-sulfur cluster assembly accessory protein [Nanoarchaeota archaeon]